jgi:hypothetical protein
MFRSHLFTMVVFSLIVSVMMGFLRNENRRDIIRYSLKLFGWMVGGVILFSWVMRYL